MIVLGFDTATPSTAVGLRLADGSTLEARDDPGAGAHPGHATRLLAMADGLLADAGIRWNALERVAVGLGPGTFTGLRVGIATARGLGQSLGVDVVGVSSLRALAEGVRPGVGEGVRVGIEPETGASKGERSSSDDRSSGVLAVLDARRGEAFAAAYLITDRGAAQELLSPRALAPASLGEAVAEAEGRPGGQVGGRWEAIGDGAVRFRSQLEGAGVTVPPDSSHVHILRAAAICELGARAQAPGSSDEALVPDYRRRPDAEIALESRQALALGLQASEGAGS